MHLVVINIAQELNLSRQEFYFKLKVQYLTTETVFYVTYVGESCIVCLTDLKGQYVSQDFSRIS
jgi:hypothetical protein